MEKVNSKKSIRGNHQWRRRIRKNDAPNNNRYRFAAIKRKAERNKRKRKREKEKQKKKSNETETSRLACSLAQLIALPLQPIDPRLKLDCCQSFSQKTLFKDR